MDTNNNRVTDATTPIRKFSGVHSKIAIVDDTDTGYIPSRGDVRFKPDPNQTIPDDDYYEVKIQMWGTKFTPQNVPYEDWLAPKKSTFFPNSWSKDRIYAEIAFAIDNSRQFESSKFNNSGNLLYRVKMTDGVTLEMWVNPTTGLIESAYPNINFDL